MKSNRKGIQEGRIILRAYVEEAPDLIIWPRRGTISLKKDFPKGQTAPLSRLKKGMEHTPAAHIN